MCRENITGRHSFGVENNIKRELKEAGNEVVDWIVLGQDKVHLSCL
jgi:hypothetical protein